MINYSNKALSNQRPFPKSGENPRDQNKEFSSNSQTRFVESNVCTQANDIEDFKNCRYLRFSKLNLMNMKGSPKQVEVFEKETPTSLNVEYARSKES